MKKNKKDSIEIIGCESLKGLQNELLLIDCGKRKGDLYNEKYEVYADSVNNNIVLALFLTQKDDFPNNVLKKVVGATKEKQYDYLISTLNQNKNMLVIWAQWEKSHGAYMIYYKEVKTCWKRYSDIDSLVDFGVNSSDYIQIKKGEVKPIDFD